MSIIKFRPYDVKPAWFNNTEFSTLRNEMNRLIDGFFGETQTPFTQRVFPAVNVFSDNDNVYVTAELPGFETKDVELMVEGDTLRLKGDRIVKSEEKDGYYHRKERQDLSFSRLINLPVSIDTSKVNAEMKNGILKITLPKAEEVKPKKIEVKIA